MSDVDEDREARARLDAALAALDRPLVALSGGVDSVLLAARAAAVADAGKRGAAATLTGVLFSEDEARRAEAVARAFGLPLHAVPFDALAVGAVRDNPPDRCYHCKRAGMGRLLDFARAHGYGPLLDGQNVDDADDYRPGARAAAELGVVSPLRDAGFTKAMIRRWSRALSLPTADAPSAACLASRVPYGTPLTVDALRRIDRAERWLRARGFATARVRAHGDLARVELDAEAIPRLAAPPLRDEARAAFEALGFRYVAVDLAGYRMGSLNPVH